MEIRKCLQDIPEYIPGRTLEEIKKKYGLREVYKLASNENMEGPHKAVVDAICREAAKVNYYPDANCTLLREKLAQLLNTDEDNLIIGNGTDQVIEMLCDCYVENSSNVVVADPTFLIYEKAALKCGGEVRKIPLSQFRQDIKNMVSAVDSHTKILFLTSPHNPTGTAISQKDFEYVLERLQGQALVVLDEAYVEYVSPEADVNSLSYLNKFSNLVILRTFSKIFALAGLRVGYGAADKRIIKDLNRIRLPFNVNSLAQAAALAALNHRQEIESSVKQIQQEKKKFYSRLDEHNIRYIDSQANFFIIETGKYTNQIIEELLRQGFIVRPGCNLGIDGFIRVTISLPPINDKFLENFIKIYHQYNN